MAYEKLTGTFESSNGTDNCAYYIYVPVLPMNVGYKGIIQISHGMCEYIERYEHFADFLTSHGYIVCGNDHLGHGNSVRSNDDLGFFAEKDGWSHLVNDLHRMTMIMKKKYPALPYILIGHSMGSFVARLYLTRFPNELTCAVIMGTGDDKALSEIGVRATRSVVSLKGERFRSDKLNTLIFGVYNDKIKDCQTIYDWLTHDRDVVKSISMMKRAISCLRQADLLTLLPFFAEYQVSSGLKRCRKSYLLYLWQERQTLSADTARA